MPTHIWVMVFLFLGFAVLTWYNFKPKEQPNIDLLTTEATYLIGAWLGITQKQGEIDKEKFQQITTELLLLESGFVKNKDHASAVMTSRFRDGWSNAYPDDWKT